MIPAIIQVDHGSSLSLVQSLRRQAHTSLVPMQTLPYLTVCARGEEGSGQMLGLHTGQGWNVRKGVRMQL